jgi:2-keto-3-deoxy-L-rhamnonate aldolase RhmA
MGLGSPSVAGLLAYAGFEWLVIETEHNAMGMAEIERCIAAIEPTETVPIVRVPSTDPIFIQRVLDIGARGIVVPRIENAEQARAVVAATRYPPEGIRGFGPLRASQFNHNITEYFETINENILVVFIIETKEAIENLEEIASVPGVDGFFMGQCDLCLSLDLHPMKYNEYPEIAEAIAKTLRIGKHHGIATGMNSFSPESLKRHLEEGHTILAYGPEYVLLSQAAKEGIQSFRDFPSAKDS